jgi:hypothetical protein
MRDADAHRTAADDGCPFDHRRSASPAPPRVPGIAARETQLTRMTELVSRDIGVALFVLFSAYGLIGTLRIGPLAPGPRPWAVFAVLEMIEAVQVYALVAGPSPRPEADVRAAAVVSLGAL